MKPLLSIGMIFKNEIRCLERCMKALQPLRDAVPCELVMADTGSDDGSREVAAKYADILFDFLWINDFAAARNAVMDRCSGEWYFSIDADEWLDGNISQLVRFLTTQELWTWSFGGVIIRNYASLDVDEEYNDFLGVRLVRLSAGVRYEGAIHELLNQTGDVYVLNRTILHHDGYANAIMEQKDKTERNMNLLRELLAQDPEDLKTLMQCVESSQGTTAYEGYIRQAAAAVEKEPLKRTNYGPPIMRYAVIWAAAQHLPELEQWRSEMLEWFPDSIYTNIDVACALFVDYADKQEYARAIPMGERYLRALSEYKEGQFDYKALIFSTLVASSQSREDSIRTILADQYFRNKQMQEACDMILSVDRSRIRPDAAGNYVGVLMNLHAQSREDLSPVMADLWEKTGQSKKEKELRAALVSAASAAFSAVKRAEEEEKGYAHAYTIFLPLAGRCGLGTAAAILESGDRVEIERLLRTVDDWGELPIAALERALLAGVAFPLPDRPLKLEEMDGLAARLAQGGEHLTEFLDKAVRAMDEEPQALAWTRGLALAALRSQDWEAGGDGMAVIKAFTAVERVFLRQYYAPAMLCGENIRLLPPMHRFGWYCVQAFDTLDAGDKAGYVRLLREGLESCQEAKPIVEFLLGQLEESQKVQPMPELLALAEQVRTLLAQYPADDPAVEALKQSAAYQKVAHLIEGPELGVFGGFAQ